MIVQSQPGYFCRLQLNFRCVYLMLHFFHPDQKHFVLRFPRVGFFYNIRCFSEAFSAVPFFFVMAEDSVWCSAQLSHPYVNGTFVRMWWQGSTKN